MNNNNDEKKGTTLKKLLKFLENNKEYLSNYKNITDFKSNINSLYNNIINDNYDSLQFDIPESIEIYENNLFYYYSKSTDGIEKEISIIFKNCKKFNFILIKDNMYDIYCKNTKCIMLQAGDMKIFINEKIIKKDKIKTKRLKS